MDLRDLYCILSDHFDASTLRQAQGIACKVTSTGSVTRYGEVTADGS